MKKSFPLSDPKHQPARVVAAIKNDVRKYLKRERRKPLPDGADYWDFDCAVGKDAQPPETKHVEEIIAAIDEAAAANCESVYLQILSKPGVRKRA